MDGFKNSSKTQYMKGGDVSCYAKGGAVKGAAKISKVMGEFKKGELHSGSKKGPEVTSRKQATAIAMSEARKAGAKMPQPVQKKSLGGVLEAVAPGALGAIAGAGGFGLSGLLLQQLLKKKQSGQPMTTAEQQKLAQAQSAPAATPKKTGGAIHKNNGGAVARGNRVSAEEAGESRLVRRAPPRKTGMTAEERDMAETIARGNRVSAEEAGESRLMRRGVPAHRSAPMISRKAGGLAAMPKGKKC